MKRLLTLLCSLVVVVSNAQVSSSLGQQIDSVTKVNSEYTSLIEKNNQLIQELKEELIFVESSMDSIFSIPVKTKESIFIREMPSLFAKISFTIPKGSNIIVIGYKSEFFTVKFQNQSGFAFYSNIPLNDELNRIMEYYTIKEKKDAAINYAKLQEKWKEEKHTAVEKEATIRAENEAIKKQKMIKEYGIINADKIMSGKIWIGMTSEMAIDSWGEPKDINRTVTNYGTNEQWVYSDKNLLYFKNGKLTAWQD